MTLPEKFSDSEFIIAVGAFAILIAGVLTGLGKMDGMAFAAACAAFFGGSAFAALRK